VLGAVSAFALFAVWVPFFRGMRICLQARIATRRIGQSQLRKSLADGAGEDVQSIALLMARILRKSMRERDSETPSEFVLDASRQYVVNEYDANFTRMISMYAGLLPPIGFIGTTGGMLILFLSMHMSDSSLELGALALALTSSIFALMGFAALEALKIKLYGRLLGCLGDVQSLFRAAEEQRDSRATATA